MDTVREGRKSGTIEADTFGRLKCTDCNRKLGAEDLPDEVGTKRICPECGTAWKKLP